MCHWRREASTKDSKECNCCGGTFKDHRVHVVKCPTCRFLNYLPDRSEFFYDELSDIDKYEYITEHDDYRLEEKQSPEYDLLRAEAWLIIRMFYLKVLTKKEAKVIHFRVIRNYSLDFLAKPKTKSYNRESIKQIESSARNKFRHPHTLSKVLFKDVTLSTYFDIRRFDFHYPDANLNLKM